MQRRDISLQCTDGNMKVADHLGDSYAAVIFYQIANLLLAYSQFYANMIGVMIGIISVSGIKFTVNRNQCTVDVVLYFRFGKPYAFVERAWRLRLSFIYFPFHQSLLLTLKVFQEVNFYR